MLKWFGPNEGEAKRACRRFVKKGADQGRRPDLVGCGLIRFQGGWSVVKALAPPSAIAKTLYRSDNHESN